MSKFIVEILFKNGAERVYETDLTNGIREYGEEKIKSALVDDLINGIVKPAIRNNIGADIEMVVGNTTHIVNVKDISDFGYRFE